MVVGEPRLLGRSLDVHLEVAFGVGWRHDKEFHLGTCSWSLFVFLQRVGVHKQDTRSQIPRSVG